jgi:DNA-binding transcriptional regulator YiaG
MGKNLENKPEENFGRSKEYWIGWALAYYQWYTSRKYSDILKVVSFDELAQLYYALHEADISKFVDVINKRIEEVFPETNLKRIRNAYGITQSELAKISGVTLRSIQMYEQRNKDINKASAESLYRIAKVLGCAIEDLIET